MPVTKNVRDAIHGFIELPPRLLGFLDTEVVQRLRGIQQLALTHLVYPGATHTRFEHSLGASYVAREIAERVKPEAETVVGIAALLHDVGHGPFSHVLDLIMEQRLGGGIHERVSRAIVLSGRLSSLFEGEEEARRVADLIDPPRGIRSMEQDIVNGPTDADKFDYLLRDSHYCGVTYGRFDVHRLYETAMRIGDEPDQLGFEEGGLEAVEGLLLARRSMHRQVYRQKTRRATDLMLWRSLVIAIDQGDERVSRLVPELIDGRPDISEAFLENYVGEDDELIRRHLETLNGPAGEIARALRKRDLVHEVCQLGPSELTAAKSSRFVAVLMDPEKMTAEVREQIEGSVASDLDADPHWIFVTVESETNPLYRAPGWNESPGDIIIAREGREHEMFHELSDLWRDYGGGPKFMRLSLFTKREEQKKSEFQSLDRRGWQDYLIRKVAESLGE